ncbi:restriction endonuclease subunit S [Pseudomonas sp. Marseille-Q1929]|uniref:restriction endonuclease subunit S n=1 Tax=Pseudomonas sp. Marseille-Q1929 TaxID=2730402 RepID=UPI001A8F462E|nr:restriction endonuclease subunit S [Pseudomonas sp. Marseille-Q1929]MBO0494645.1 restriction endonuclease subunit S [Pseudomonas sp. Marseille-Q1929]
MSFPKYSAYKKSGVTWLEQLPEHWSYVRLQNIAQVIDPQPDHRAPALAENNDGYPYVGIRDVNQDGSLNFDTARKVDISAIIKQEASFSIDVGDIVYCKVGTLGLPRKIRAHGRCALSATLVLIKSGDVDSQFLMYSLDAAHTYEQVNCLSTGSTRAALGIDQIRKFFQPYPPKHEQIFIARFLDHETARIDALIEELQRLIEVLKEQRKAMISLAVTKGLDPTVPMKDSGVEWLGEVPEHWEVKQLKHVVDPNTSITYGIVQAGPEFEGGIPYIRTSDMSGKALPISGYPLTSPEIDESYARSRVRPGDIVMSIRASVGKCLPVPDELKVANLTQGTAKISAGQGITRNFLLAFLNAEATQNYFDLMAKGATFKEITLDALRRTPVLLPPAGEQIKIDQFVARNADLLNETCKQAIQSLSLLQERRSALISAAVTGKIDVRGWQPLASAPIPELLEEAV